MICPRCSGAIPTGLSICAPCRDRDRMSVDIRARILWGEGPAEIRTGWLRKGALETDVDKFLQVSLQERREHFRTRGLQDLLIALGVFLLGAVAFWMRHAEATHQILLRPKIHGMVLAGMLFLPPVGIILSIRGVRRILIGGEQTEAASDMSEFD